MESPAERSQKLASARKKLKKFKNQKGVKSDDEQKEKSHADTPAISYPESSAVESLLQLSSQLNGLITNNHEPQTNGVNSHHMQPNQNGPAATQGRKSPIGGSYSASADDSLLGRNQQLADKVGELQQRNTQLTRQLEIQKEHLTSLQEQLDKGENETVEKTKHELLQSKEQLQVHIQTIGILVEEKQMLQKQLSSAQRHSQQKVDELDDTTSRLKASRLRVADLEKQFALLSTQKARAESAQDNDSKQIEKLKADLYAKKRDFDDVFEQKTQLEKQLASKMSQNARLETSVTDLQGKLELTQAYVDQIKNGSTDAQPDLYAQQIEELQSKNTSLHENIAQLENALQTVTSERTQVEEQYNQVLLSLKHEQQQVHSQLVASQNMNKTLDMELNELRANNSQLNYQIEHMQANTTTGKEAEEKPQEDNSEYVRQLTSQLQQLSQYNEQVQLQLEAVCKNYDALSSDNQQLSKLLDEKEDRISDLESILERVQDEKHTSKKLLESVEGDRSALSRALSQNKLLKTQMEELEARFVKITQEHMETVSSFQTEQHLNKELSAKLDLVEEQLKSATDGLADRDNYISENREKMDQIVKMSHQQEQLADRIRHYEAKIQMTEALQRELHSSQETVRALSAQNAELRQMIVDKGTSRQNSVAVDGDVGETQLLEADNNQDLINQLTATIKQLESEREQLNDRYEETMAENSRLSNQLLSQTDTPAESTFHCSKEQYEATHHALNRLQDKYTIVMKAKAELLDRSEILEHENLQLQAESETINEYIQLYHHQRSLMKQRAEEKDRVIQKLSEEREKVTVKLSELQALVVKLLQERKYLQSYSQPNHAPVATDSELNSRHDLDLDILDVSSTNSSGGDAAMDVTADGELQGASTPVIDLSQDFIDGHEQVPGVTAQRIMTLFSEIGHNNKVDRDTSIPHILHCSHCSGPVVTT